MARILPYSIDRVRACLRSLAVVALIVALVAALIAAPGSAAAAFESWLVQRDRGVVRQRYDFSCGLAALATIMTYHFGDNVDELTLVRALRSLSIGGDHPTIGPEWGLSFADLANIARRRGYLARGFLVSVTDLERLRQPVVVALVVDGRAHFSVLQRVDERGVFHLADPSWGNRRLTGREFRRYFSEPSTTGAEVGRRGGDRADRGRMLMILPQAALPGDGLQPRLPPRPPVVKARVLMRPASMQLPFGQE